jgi:hypothetical protein
MPLQRHFPSLRLQFAEALYAAAGCKEWPLCTEEGGCADVYHLLPEVGLTFHTDEPVNYRYPSIAPWELKPVLDTLFTMTRFSTLREPNIFEGFQEIPREIGELLEVNDGAWREELGRIAKAKRRSSAHQKSVIQFVSEMLEIALPDSYLDQCPPQPDDFVEDPSLSLDSEVVDTLNAEERLLLIDNLWIPEWSAPLPKSARRLIGLVLAAIDGRPYATPFVTVDGNHIEHYVEMSIDLVKAFGFSEDESMQALRKAMSGILEIHNAAGTTAPFTFNT